MPPSAPAIPPANATPGANPRIRARRAVTLAAVAAVAILTAALWLAVRPPREPLHEGRTASEWLAIVAGKAVRADPEEWAPRARRVLDQLGTNAFPTIERAYLEQSRIRDWLEYAWNHLPRPLRTRWPEPVTAMRLRETASMLVAEWPPERRKAFARQITPKLLELVLRPDTRDREYLVGGLLRQLQPDVEEVLPTLRQLLRDPNLRLRESVLFLLVDYQRAATPAVPELVETLDADPSTDNIQCLNFAVSLLSMIGEPARPAVPRLERLLASGFDDVLVARALWHIDRQTNTALRYLTNAIEDRSGNAAYTLGTMGEAGQPAVPFLLLGLDSPVGNVRMNSARAVWKIAPEHLPLAIAAILRPLTNGLQAPASMEAHGAAWYAAHVLREFGTNAASARWALELGAQSRQPNIASECRQALAALDAASADP